MKYTHSDRLERWLGPDVVANLSKQMEKFYWPVAVHGVPGAVYAMPGGDFTGDILAGQEMSAYDRAEDILSRGMIKARASISKNRIIHRSEQRQQQRDTQTQSKEQRNYAFASLSAIIAAQTGGKGQLLTFSKTGTASNAIGNANDLWIRSGQPSAGAAGAAAPGGTASTSATAGALRFVNPGNADTSHFVAGYVTSTVAANTLMLYDRMFSVAKTMNSGATEAVTGTFSRYQNTTAGTEDYIGGNFCFPMNPTTVLAATAHNWTVCQYTNETGSGTRNFPSIAGVSACSVSGVDLAAGSWFMPLAAGDVGVQKLTQMQCSTTVATGTITFVVAHPIAFFPCPVANLVCPMDGIYTALSLQRIYDDACLAFMELPKPATTATSYSGFIQMVAE